MPPILRWCNVVAGIRQLNVLKIITIIVVLFTVQSPSYAQDDPSPKQSEILARLDAAAIWLLGEGVNRLRSPSKYEPVKDVLIKRFSVQMWAVPSQGKEYPDDLRIKAGGIYNEIRRLAISEQENKRFEYWIIKSTSRDWLETPVKKVQFVGVKREDNLKEATVFWQSDRFADYLEYQGIRVLSLDLTDPYIWHVSEAYSFPEFYEESVLRDYAVYPVDKKNFEMMSAELYQKINHSWWYRLLHYIGFIRSVPFSPPDMLKK